MTPKHAQISLPHARSRRNWFAPILTMLVLYAVLGLIDAALGRKDEALREGRRAVELLPVEKDAINGTRLIVALATNRCIGWRQ